MDTLERTPVTASHIHNWTSCDPAPSTVLQKVQNGWKGSTNDELWPYERSKDELSVHDECLLWGNREYLSCHKVEQAHRWVARRSPGDDQNERTCKIINFVWWPCINKDLQERGNTCHQCQHTWKAPPVAPVHLWEWAGRPWTQVHVDHADHFLGKMHCKNKLIFLTTEWLPWLQTNWRGSNYKRFALVLKTNSIRHPRGSCTVHLTTTTLRTSARESPACTKSMEVPYCNFEVHL